MKEQNVKDTQRKNDEMNFLENFLVSGAAAVISKTVAAPIERVKLLVQNQDELLKVGFLDRPYNGVIDCTMRTYHSEGIIPFWRGNLANCIRYLPTQGLNFAFKDKIKEAFHPGPSDPYLMSLGKNIASGGVAGGLSLCFVYSLDYARTRLGNDVTNAKGGKRQFNGLIDVYVKTMKSDGIVGLYRGFVISCVGIVVYRGAYFGLYDTLKPIMLGEQAGFFLSFVLGYGVTVVSEVVAYPFDTIRRRMMMTSGEQVKYRSSLECAKHIYRTEGPMSFMKGTFANILRGVAGAGVLVGFDKIKELYLKLRNTI